MQLQQANRTADPSFPRANCGRWTGQALVGSLHYAMGIDPSSICQFRYPLCPVGVENDGRRTGGQAGYRERVQIAVETFDALVTGSGRAGVRSQIRRLRGMLSAVSR